MNGIRKITEWLFYAYIFCMPFTSVLAYSSTIFPSLIIAILLLVLITSRIIFINQPLPVKISGIDIFLVIILTACVIFSYLFNGIQYPKSLNHTVAYLTSFILFYLLIRLTMAILPDRRLVFSNIIRIITVTCILSCVYACTEFILKNFSFVNIDELVPRAKNEEDIFNPLILGFFIRARGFAAESGHFMFMLELLAPVSVYYMYHSGFCNWKKWFKAAAIAIIIAAMLLSGSVAGYLIIPTALLASVILRFRSSVMFISGNFKKIITVIVILTGVTIALYAFLPINEMIAVAVSEKLDSNSLEDREERNDFFYREFPRLPLVNKIVGAGPAATLILGFSSGNSILNLYLSVCFEIGLLGVLVFIIFILGTFFRAISIKDKFGFFLTFSILAGIIHYYLIANYWYPWFWFIGALTFFYTECNEEIKKPANS